MGKVRAVCVSDVRGVQKKNVERAWFATEHGIQGDAHAGNWHRQVSLLSQERIDDFNQRGAGVPEFDFDRYLQAFCKRKYESDFSREMSRSAAVYLKDFL